MYAILSPAKKLDFEVNLKGVTPTKPLFPDQAEALVAVAKQWTKSDLKSLMGLSDNLATLNYNRFQGFEPLPGTHAKPALFVFRGDTYQGLDVDSLDKDDIEYAQHHVGVLSGLYGLLRAKDAIQPYRLEMGTKVKTDKGSSLYDFWEDTISRKLNALAKGAAVINLASNEYVSAVDKQALEVPFMDVVFQEIKGGKPPKVIGLYAKKARGMMARFIIQNRIESPEGLQKFDTAGYQFVKSESSESKYVFRREIE